MLYQFGAFRIDLANRQVWRASQPLQLTPKAFDLLVVLVESEGRLLKKQDLMDRLWPDSFVEESCLTQNIATVRKTLGDSPAVHQFILTVPKQGYRFVAPVVTCAANRVTAQERSRPNNFRTLQLAAAVGIVLLAVIVRLIMTP